MTAIAADRPLAQLACDHVQAFRHQGFCHLQGWIPPALCRSLIHAFTTQVKPWGEPLLRQRSAAFEPHRYTAQGYMENALLDVHRQDLFDFESFSERAAGTLARPDLLALVSTLLGEPARLVQSMYFEGSKGTPEHFDAHFLSTDEARPMLGVWIALEDIHPSDGRFFVYPGSHDETFAQHPDPLALRTLREAYAHQAQTAIHGHQDDADRSQREAVMRSKRSLRQLIARAGWQRHHPAMAAGDVIVFSSHLLHGSEVPCHAHTSRHSLTGHFVTASQRHIRYGQVTEAIAPATAFGLSVHWSGRHRYINLKADQQEQAWTD